MPRILLYLSLLLASGVCLGNGLSAAVEDTHPSLLAQERILDSNELQEPSLDAEDQPLAAVSDPSPVVLRQPVPPASHPAAVLISRTAAPYAIRAPPAA